MTLKKNIYPNVQKCSKKVHNIRYIPFKILGSILMLLAQIWVPIFQFWFYFSQILDIVASYQFQEKLLSLKLKKMAKDLILRLV